MWQVMFSEKSYFLKCDFSESITRHEKISRKHSLNYVEHMGARPTRTLNFTNTDLFLLYYVSSYVQNRFESRLLAKVWVVRGGVRKLGHILFISRKHMCFKAWF